MDFSADQLLERIPAGSPWIDHVGGAFAHRAVGLHLAIFAEPYLSRALSGEKTIESRFSRNRCAPFNVVREGDIILLKAVAGPICGLSIARQTWHFDLALLPIGHVRETFGAAICAEEDFWISRRDAAYATLIELSDTIAITPLSYAKRDRRGWVSLWGQQLALAF